LDHGFDVDQVRNTQASQLMFVNPTMCGSSPTRLSQREDAAPKAREADANSSRFALALLMSKGDIVSQRCVEQISFCCSWR